MLQPDNPPESSEVDVVKTTSPADPLDMTTKYSVPAESVVLAGAVNVLVPAINVDGGVRVATSVPALVEDRPVVILTVMPDGAVGGLNLISTLVRVELVPAVNPCA